MIAVSNPTVSGESLAKLIDELSARAQAGESPDLEALKAEFPQHATELERLLPAVAVLADLSRNGMFPIDGAATSKEPLGDFRLIREVGRGGMGVVYEATQMSLNRRVALKVLPFAATMDPKHLQRFHNEARAAASLRHEHIVHVYGVGCERGVHYYAMEFIEGHTLAQVIARQTAPSIDATADLRAAGADSPTAPVAALSTEPGRPKGREYYRTAAELIATAADALEHAHSLGVVHRDIKPANLMVDAIGKLWVTDFGLARIGSDAGLTASGDMLGTLRYMSPEQALAKHGLVDHRTDVYALGATLYELLTLRPTVPGEDKNEVLQRIAFEEPAALRKIDRGIPVELETITLKALAKNPAERYASAKELADDLRHWMEDKPIRARRPSSFDRASKWASRHRALVALTMSFLALATVGLTVGTLLLNSANRDLVEQRQQTANEAAIAKAYADFFLNDIIAAAAPHRNARTKQMTLEEVLGRAAERIKGKFDGMPLVESTVRDFIGVTFMHLGNYSAAKPHLERAVDIRRQQLGENHVDTLTMARKLGILYLDQGDSANSKALLLKVVEGYRGTLGNEHSLTQIAVVSLGRALSTRGEYSLAEPLLIESVDTLGRVAGEEDENTLEAKEGLARVLRELGRFNKAEQILVKLLDVRRAEVGELNFKTLATMNLLAQVYQSQDRFAEAESLFKRSLEGRRHIFGAGHPDTLLGLNNLAEILRVQGRSIEAEPLLIEALEFAQRSLGDKHDTTLTIKHNLANVYTATGKQPQAEVIYLEVLDARRQMLGDEHPNTVSTMNQLALFYRSRNQLDKAEALAIETLALSRKALGDDHPNSITSALNMAILHQAKGRRIEAESLFVQTLERSRRVHGNEHRATIGCMEHLAMLYRNQDRYSDTVPLYREVLEARRKKYGDDASQTGQALFSLGLAYFQQQLFAEAEPLLRSCHAIQAQKEPDVWLTYNTKSVLGRCLACQDKYDEAEPLLLAGFEGIEKRKNQIPGKARLYRLGEAAERLAKFYEATGNKEKAAEWLEKANIIKAELK